MNGDILKKIIVESREFIESVSLVPRNYKIEQKGNYVFIGQRRTGKTFLIYQLIKQLNINNFLFINFEDERLIEFTIHDFDLLLDSYKELYNHNPVIFFDEIQNIEGWQKFCRRLVDTGFQVYITGSNATLLSNEIATTLGGRFLINEVFPLSFLEYIEFNGIELTTNWEYGELKNVVLNHQNDYIYYGGLPECLKYTDKRNYLSNTFQKVFFSDIIARYKVKNNLALKMLVKKLAESVNNETSFNRLKNIIQSANIKIGNSTLFDYIHHLEDAFLISSISNFTAKFSERETKKKFYFGDNGILNLFLVDQDTKLLENVVFIELRRKHNAPIFYFKRNLEVDFYIPDKKLLIQVSYSVKDYDTRKREIRALNLAMKELSLNKSYIVTYNEEDSVKIEDGEIHITPYWKWTLLSNPD